MTGKIKIGMDVAASEFCKDGKYDLDFKSEVLATLKLDPKLGLYYQFYHYRFCQLQPDNSCYRTHPFLGAKTLSAHLPNSIYPSCTDFT